MADDIRVVADTNVLISRLLAPRSAPARVVSHAVRHGRLLASNATFEELVEVLSRAKFDRYIHLSERQQFIRLLARIVEMPPITYRFSVCDDASDNKFLDLAVSGTASVIVTGDHALLDLHPFNEIPIVRPATYRDQMDRNCQP